jgi:F-type H+-transporting ATPase subunit epsilon
MYTQFPLEIMTPEKLFFSGNAEAVTVLAPDGEVTVLAGHAPLVAPIAASDIAIRMDGEWKTACASEGFMEVGRGGTVIFLQTCEWPEDIDALRAKQEKDAAEELLRQKQSISEYKNTKIELARAMARLRTRNTKISLD